MHIEPGIVDGAKIVLSYGTAAASLGILAKAAFDAIRANGFLGLAVKSVVATLLVFSFFEILPHYPVGVSEVHFILGSTLFLMLGLAPAMIGLAIGLLVQGLLFSPFDLPQYGVNLTTLLVPLYMMSLLAKRIIPAQTAYKDVGYTQALALSTSFQGGIIAWVMFWAFYGQGFGMENFTSIATFSTAYLSVILFEPLIDLAVLAAAKNLHGLKDSVFVEKRLYAGTAG